MNHMILMISILMCIGCQPSHTTEAQKSELKRQVKAQVQPSSAKALGSVQDVGATLIAYETTLDKTIQVLSGSDDAKIIKDQAVKLFKLGRVLTRYVRSKKPECSEYLSSLLSVNDALLKLSPQEIEAGYHRDGRLPKNPNPTCHHAKDLMVHPATVIVLNQVTPRVKVELMLREVLELKGHLSEIKKLSDVPKH